MKKPKETDEIYDAPKAAFNRSGAGYEYAGNKLHKFTAQRQAAAAGMGMRFGLVNEADIFSVTVETLQKKKKVSSEIQFYNQMFADVITAIWLCFMPESRVMRALRKPDEAQSEAFAWADTQGISLTSVRYYEAAGVFLQIMQDITVSTGIPQPKEGETDHEDPND